jgi:WD40 repeat protein
VILTNKNTVNCYFFKEKSIQILSEQEGFVQGVAWDPKNKFVATLSSDRSCRVYSLMTNKVVQKLNSVLHFILQLIPF